MSSSVVHARHYESSYFLEVNPLWTFPGANIRQVREEFVAQLVKDIIEDGWLPSSCPIVYEPVPEKRLRDYINDLRASRKRKLIPIMDGAHRMAALRRLMFDREVTAFGRNHLVTVRVIPAADTSVQRTVSAALENGGKALAARRTFCDEIWANIGIQADCVKRIVAFSTAVAEMAAAAEAPKRGKLEFSDIPNLPPETRSFIEVYKKAIDPLLYDKKASVRVPFDPSQNPDFPGVVTMIKMLQDCVLYTIPKHNPVENRSQNHVKWRITRRLHPVDTTLKLNAFSSMQDEGDDDADDDANDYDADGDMIGGSGIVRLGRDDRPWDYWCLVNCSVNAGGADALSYHRVYNPYLYRAFGEHYTFCAVLMMQKLQHDERDNTGRFAGRKVRTGRMQEEDNTVSTKQANYLCRMTAAVYKQYDGAASIVPGYSGIEELIYPYITLDRELLKFRILPEGMWSAQSESRVFDKKAEIDSLHPTHHCPWHELSLSEQAKDAERRKMAELFLADIESLTTENAERAIGLFKFRMVPHDEPKKAARIAFADVPAAEISPYVRSQFSYLKHHGVLSALQVMGIHSRDESESPSSKGHKARPDSEGSDGETDEILPAKKRARTLSEADEIQPATKKATTVSDSTSVVAAKEAALAHLSGVVFMACDTFQNWGRSSQCRSLHGTVALILTDPPYNTRRVAGASNSGHDALSSSEIADAANLIADLLRPSGQAYIFCSFMQGADWIRALQAAGGGKVLVVSEKPEFVIRDGSTINGGGRRLYHRASAGEVAIHAYKSMAASKPGAPTFEELFPHSTYGDMVAFGKPTTRLTSDSGMPTYASAFTNYQPPTGRRLLKVDGAVLRPEQKGVSLLRDIIRLFAPKPTDIVVDIFAGTMSTVAAALLEGHPVYACEPDKKCFEAATGRIHALQYRRVANGLITTIDRSHVKALRSTIPPCAKAIDIVDGEVERRAERSDSQSAD